MDYIWNITGSWGALIMAAIRSEPSNGLNGQPEEIFEITVNEQSEDSGIYGNSTEDSYFHESVDEKPVEVIIGFITDINENRLIIEESYQGENALVTIDSYDFSYDEYHQCSNRNDLEDLQNADIGDFVLAVRPLDKTQDTIAVCFEIMDVYPDIALEDNSYDDYQEKENEEMPSIVGAYISVDSMLMMDITSPYNNGIYKVSVWSTGGNYGNDYYDFSGELDVASGTISYSNCTHTYKSNQAGQGSTIVGENLSGTLTYVPGTQISWTWSNPDGPDTSATFDYFFNPALM